MRTYLVTGGAGFIGSNYIHYMFKKYDNEIFAVFRIFLSNFSRAQTVPYAFRSIKTPQISSEVSFDYRLVSKKVFVQ